MEWRLDRTAGTTVNIMAHAKHDATSLGVDARLHWELMYADADTWLNPVRSVIEQWIAADSTDWQTHQFSLNRTNDRPLILRCYAYRASGNAYAFADPSGAASSGGGNYGY